MKNFENLKVLLSYIVVLTFFYLGYKFRKEDKETLNKYGKITKGIIIDIRSRSRGHQAKYNFWFNGRKIMSVDNVKAYRYEVGDTIEVIFYPKDPKINRILSEYIK